MGKRRSNRIATCAFRSSTRPCRRINSQYLDEFRNFSQVAQCVSGGLIVPTENIGKKHVFPRSPAHRPRLNLAQADVAQRKYAERLEQHSRHVLERESNGTLMSVGRYLP